MYSTVPLVVTNTLHIALYIQECTSKFVFTNIFLRIARKTILNFLQVTIVRKKNTFGNLRFVE